MSNDEATDEPLPPFVVREGGELRLQRGRAWLTAIFGPLLMYAVAFFVLALILRPSFASGWYTRGGFTTGTLASMTIGCSCAKVLKQERAIRLGVTKLPWHQLSAVELLAYTTGFAVAMAIGAFRQQWLS